MKGISKVQAQAIACVLGSAALYGILTVTMPAGSVVSEEGQIVRESVGGNQQQISLWVEGVGGDPVEMTLEVGAKEYSEDEANQVFSTIMDTMAQRMVGANASLLEVTQDLMLPTWIEEYGISLRWMSSDGEVIDSKGRLQPNVWSSKEEKQPKQIYIHVELSDGIHKKSYEIPVTVIPPDITEEERLEQGLKSEIREQEKRQRAKPYMSLPAEYEGRPLHYKTEPPSGYASLLILGGILAGLCYAREQSDIREREKRRERELLLDYAELLSKLMIFIGAGMTVRGAWERMVKDYEGAVQAGRQKRRAAYEEMEQTYYQLQSGLPEGEAYRNFGRRCRLQPYLKLSSLLEQNRKTGMKNLRGILQMEISDAFEARKNLARRLGEEAGTKLLLPLFLMLGIIMVMIMVPAMMTMG